MRDLKDLQKLLDKASKEIPQKTLRIIGKEGKKNITKSFRDVGFTDGSTQKWEPRKTTDKTGRDLTRYRTDRKGKKGNLTKFGNQIKGRALLAGLRSSIQYRISLGSKQVSFHTYKKYAKRHNEGLDGMPKREFMGKSNFLNNQIKSKITIELNSIFN